MSALKQKLARFGATAGVLAGATAAIFAVGGATAGSASAACTGGTIEGAGSSLQKIAQTVAWAPGWEAGSCGTGANAKVKYAATSSGKGLAQWGYSGSGTVNTALAIIGTDDGPSSTQISAAKTAGNNANTVIVPVAQTAIAVIVHPPANCAITQISNAHLDEAFSGKATTWAGIGATGTGCTGSLTRVVRFEGSGTTYQFKNYLAKIRGWTESGGSAGETAPCSGSEKWSALEPIGAEEKPNKVWPSCGTIATVTAEGGGGVASKVVSTAGTIGYSALPDAKGAGASVLKVEGGTVGGKVVFNAPEAGEEAANCSNAKYNVPTTGRETGGTGLDVDWSQVFGGNPAITGSYPICTLTYDLGWHNYSTAGFGSTIGAQVKNYYGFELSTESLGSGTKTHWYSAPPSTPSTEATDVLRAAKFAVTKIG